LQKPVQFVNYLAKFSSVPNGKPNESRQGGFVRTQIFGKKAVGVLVALGLALLLLGPGPVRAETLEVIQPNQSLYPEPDFAGAPVGVVPQGARVQVVRQAGDWYKVNYQGMEGWLHRQAFPAPPPKSGGLNLPGLLFGAPAKETSSDEVALAGKGFTPEIESGYRQKHPELNFAQVDKVETFTVPPATLGAFIKEGGLNP
jgi:hypothetical protein